MITAECSLRSRKIFTTRSLSTAPRMVPPLPVGPIPASNPGRLGPNPGAAPSKTLDPNAQPALFTPLTLRNVTFKNRIVVSPMCQYSAVDGVPNAWHIQHLGQLASRGAGAVIVEATAVQRNGRISPNDLGLWNDEQEKAFLPIVEFLKSQGAVAAIQLAHAGRKASVYSPFIKSGEHNALAPEEDGGWPSDIVAPSPLKGWPISGNPREMSGSDIAELIQAFADSATRADRIGFDVIELHAAHGYLLHSFFSPLSNHRTDTYGGSLANRARLIVQVSSAVRKVWPSSKPLFVRVSATDFAAGGITIEDTVYLAQKLGEVGVDLIDCSSGGLVPNQDVSQLGQPGYNVPFAARVRADAAIATGAVGQITDAAQAEKILAEGKADLVLLARALLRNPSWPLDAAAALGAEVEWPWQYRRGRPRM